MKWTSAILTSFFVTSALSQGIPSDMPSGTEKRLEETPEGKIITVYYNPEEEESTATWRYLHRDKISDSGIRVSDSDVKEWATKTFSITPNGMVKKVIVAHDETAKHRQEYYLKKYAAYREDIKLLYKDTKSLGLSQELVQKCVSVHNTAIKSKAWRNLKERDDGKVSMAKRELEGALYKLYKLREESFAMLLKAREAEYLVWAKEHPESAAQHALKQRAVKAEYVAKKAERRARAAEETAAEAVKRAQQAEMNAADAYNAARSRR